MLRVAIWDDRKEELEALSAKVEACLNIEGRWELVRCSAAEITESVTEIEGFVEKLQFFGDSALVKLISGFDVLCIDYDLRTLNGHQWLTADSLAGLVRVFTNCPCVIVLNRPPRTAFDLTMLAGWDGPADLQVPQVSITRPEFWTADVKSQAGAFRPWSWLRKRNARARSEKRIEALRKVDWKEANVFDFLDISDIAKSRLSQRAIGALSPSISSEQRLTLHDFIISGMRVLLPDSCVKLQDAYGGDDKVYEVAIRALAFDLARWFREQLVAGQDIYVDMPHLIARCPWLLGPDKIADLSEWNGSINSLDRVFEREPWLAEYLVNQSYWGDRECFDWPRLQSDPRLSSGAAILSQIELPSFVFQEDSSCFAEDEESEGYLADFGNLWDRRYIRKNRDDVDANYGPLIRLAL